MKNFKAIEAQQKADN